MTEEKKKGLFANLAKAFASQKEKLTEDTAQHVVQQTAQQAAEAAKKEAEAAKAEVEKLKAQQQQAAALNAQQIVDARRQAELQARQAAEKAAETAKKEAEAAAAKVEAEKLKAQQQQAAAAAAQWQVDVRRKAELDAQQARMALEAQRAEEAAKAAVIKHVWTREDTYADLAFKYYGSIKEPYWRLIYEHNKKIIGNHPNDIRLGLEIEIPPLPDELKNK